MPIGGCSPRARFSSSSILPPMVHGSPDTLWGQLEKAGVQQVGFVLPEAQIKETGDWRKQIAMGHDIGSCNS